MVPPSRLFAGRPALQRGLPHGDKSEAPATGAEDSREGANMPARRSTNRFHERELARALRAAKKSGTPFDRVEVDPATGKNLGGRRQAYRRRQREDRQRSRKLDNQASCE
jgi:hypothetical protein